MVVVVVPMLDDDDLLVMMLRDRQWPKQTWALKPPSLLSAEPPDYQFAQRLAVP
jgi:hypothetical protein